MSIKTLDELESFFKRLATMPAEESATCWHFDRCLEVASKLKHSLEDHFGLPFPLRIDRQDRTDYAQISIPTDLLVPPLPQWPPEIRLSETSPLVSISDAYLVKEESVNELRAVLETAGFVFVDPTLFVCGHDGNDAELDRLWRSLFDYD